MIRKNTKVRRAIKNRYSFENYKPNKNAKPVMYKGTQYLSKVQCMMLEGITRKELDEYLKNQGNITAAKVPEQDIADKIIEDVSVDEEEDEFDEELETFVDDNEPF